MLSGTFNVGCCPSWIFIIAFQLKNVKGYPMLDVKAVFPYVIQQFFMFPVEFFSLFTR